MKLLCCTLFLIPLLLFSQQTVEICDNTQTVNYSVQSDIPSNVEWYCNGSYYYGEEITIIWSQPGTFTLTATATAADCPSNPQTLTVTVVECDPLVYWVPNTFTPNGDEFNTTWGPVFGGPYDSTDFHLFVVNRWGNVVWESYDPSARWDGTYGGKSVVDGVYTWVIDFGMLNTDERKIIHGHVTIIR